MIETINGIRFYRKNPVYAPFLPDTGRTCLFECVNPICPSGKHLLSNKNKSNEVFKNSFQLRANELAPKNIGDVITFKNCPDCGENTLVKA